MEVVIVIVDAYKLTKKQLTFTQICDDQFYRRQTDSYAKVTKYFNGLY